MTLRNPIVGEALVPEGQGAEGPHGPGVPLGRQGHTRRSHRDKGEGGQGRGAGSGGETPLPGAPRDKRPGTGTGCTGSAVPACWPEGAGAPSPPEPLFCPPGVKRRAGPAPPRLLRSSEVSGLDPSSHLSSFLLCFLHRVTSEGEGAFLAPGESVA